MLIKIKHPNVTVMIALFTFEKLQIILRRTSDKLPDSDTSYYLESHKER